jgi:magnesium transporter
MSDMENSEDSIEQTPWKRLKELIDTRDLESINQFLSKLQLTDTARAISRLPHHNQIQLINLLGPQEAAEILEEVTDEQAADILEELSPEKAAAIVDELYSDHQADILTLLDAQDAAAILQRLDSEDAKDLRAMMSYPDDVAGGLMITEFLSYPGSYTVQQVLNDLAKNREEYADYEVHYVYVTKSNEKLIGVLRLRDIFLAPRKRRLHELMVPKPSSAKLSTPLIRLDQFFDHHGFSGLPVVDEHGILEGVVKREDVKEAMAKNAESAYLKASGIVGGEELRHLPVLVRSGRRLSWLAINVLLNLMAASVIAINQDVIAQVTVLAVFLPIISDLSGSAGSQAIAVSIRELSLDLIREKEFFHVFLKELGPALINGVVLGAIVATLAVVWKGDVLLAMVVGLGLGANCFIGVIMGGVLPLLLKRLKIDPALASMPILTTMTDMAGFFMVLGLARSILM